jgi:hypothetical protein
MPAAYHRSCRLCRQHQRHPEYAKTFPGDTLIVATEPHIIHQMEKAMPDKNFIGAPGADGNCACNICPYMALNTLEKLYLALRDLKPQIEMEAAGRAVAGEEEPRPDAGDGGGTRWAGRFGGAAGFRWH